MGKPTGFMEYKREVSLEEEPKKRIEHFNEFHEHLPKEKQQLQGARCMECGVPFCQAGMIYRPTREKDVDVLKQYAYHMLKNTGHEEISLSSLSSSDYSSLKELVTFLIEEFKGNGVNISLP